MSDPLVSIIMPAYNAGSYIQEAIGSVLHQDYPHFELIIINDGSIDNTKELIHTFDDSRIRYFEQENKGVSAARNVGLNNISGEYFCFIDADDSYTKESLTSRIKVFMDNPEISFVDGIIHKLDKQGKEILDIWSPNFEGNPFEDLLMLTGNSFFGPSWMIRTSVLKTNQFKEGQTHAEDVLFYLKLSKDTQLIYSSVSTPILRYRMHDESAMNMGLEKLQLGYEEIYHELMEWNDVSTKLKKYFRKKTLSIMFRSYAANLQFTRALSQLIKRATL